MIITKSSPFTKEEIEKRNKELLGDLALDLKRVAWAYYHGSYKTAEIFLGEALKRKSELNKKNLKPHLINFLSKIDNLKERKERSADDALLYSTIFQNASQV